MRFSGICRLYFFLGWVAVWAGVELLILAEFRLRVPDPPGMYLFEAAGAILAPFGALALGDFESIRIYRAVWTGLNSHLLSVLFLERDALERLRTDMRQSLLLAAFAPRPVRNITTQLGSVAIWYRALALPTDTPWQQRFGEILLVRLSAILALPATVVMIVAFGDGTWSRYPLLGLAAFVLCVLGYHGIRTAARRQALFDYFAAWKASRDRPTEGQQELDADADAAGQIGDGSKLMAKG